MNPLQLLLDTFNGKATERRPVVPKIWFNLAAGLTGTAPCAIIEEPRQALLCVIDAALETGCDAARLFFIPERITRNVNGQVIEEDAEGRRIGAIDMSGGWATHLDRAEDFSIENPADVAFRAFRKHQEPRINSRADARRLAVPDRDFWSSAFRDRLKTAKNHAADRIALIGDCDTATLAWYIDFRGIEQALFDLIDNPPLVHSVMERGVEYAVERGKFCIDEGLCILRLNDSLANMSVISPNLWRQFIFPHMKAVCSELHRYNSEVKIYCHICGDIMPIMHDLVQTGLDGIGPLDPLGGFTVAQAREKAGQEITLIGGVNTLDFVRADAEEIARQARLCIKHGQVDSSRYILSSGCVVPPGAKKQNLLALRTASEECQ